MRLIQVKIFKNATNLNPQKTLYWTIQIYIQKVFHEMHTKNRTIYAVEEASSSTALITYNQW